MGSCPDTDIDPVWINMITFGSFKLILGLAGFSCYKKNDWRFNQSCNKFNVGIAYRGVTRIFNGGITLCQTEGTRQIVRSTTTPCFT